MNCLRLELMMRVKFDRLFSYVIIVDIWGVILGFFLVNRNISIFLGINVD